MQFDKSFTSHFVDSSTWLPITWLAGVRIVIKKKIWDYTYTKVVDNALCTEVWDWWYNYEYDGLENYFYVYAIYPNDSRVQPESGYVDKRQNYLDKPLSSIIGSFNVGGKTSQYDFGMQDRKNLEELTKLKDLIESKIEETKTHLDIAKLEITDKIESIEIPEVKIEEKEAKKVLKIVTDTSKTLKSYIDSEMKEKDEIGAISRELTKIEMEEQRQMIERKMQEDEKKKKEEEEKKKEEEEKKAEYARLAELLNKEFDKLEEQDKEEKKKELEEELKELEKEMKEKEKELKKL